MLVAVGTSLLYVLYLRSIRVGRSFKKSFVFSHLPFHWWMLRLFEPLQKLFKWIKYSSKFILDKNVVVIWFVFYFCFGMSLCHRKDKQSIQAVPWFWCLLRYLGHLPGFLIVKEDINLTVKLGTLQKKPNSSWKLFKYSGVYIL